MSVIYAVQEPHVMDAVTGELFPRFPDLPRQAREHGELRWLLSPSASPFHPEHIVSELNHKLQSYTGADYLLLVGNPILIGMAVAIAAYWNEGQVNVLQWSGRKKRYIAVNLNLSPEDVLDCPDDK